MWRMIRNCVWVGCVQASACNCLLGCSWYIKKQFAKNWCITSICNRNYIPPPQISHGMIPCSFLQTQYSTTHQNMPVTTTLSCSSAHCTMRSKSKSITAFHDTYHNVETCHLPFWYCSFISNQLKLQLA